MTALYYPIRLLPLIYYFSTCTFAVTVVPSTFNLPKAYKSDDGPVTLDFDLLSKINPSLCPVVSLDSPIVANAVPSESIWASAFPKTTDGIYAAQDSFVRGAIDASAKY